MKTLAHQSILCVLLIACAHLGIVKSQTGQDKKTGTGSISGNVSIKGKAATGITVVLRYANVGYPQATNYQAKTDEEGNYRISNLPPGSYQVSPDAQAFVVSPRSGNGIAILAEGESVERMDFSLTKGAVITGRVTNTEGQPLIEQNVELQPLEYSQSLGILQRINGLRGLTDDRGVYRIFGIPEGKYRVAVASGRRAVVRQVFHPGVYDALKATVVEVSEGSEAKNIDIAVETSSSPEKFAVSGRIIDGVSGQSIPNVGISLIPTSNTYSGLQRSGLSSDNKGQFRIDRLAAGSYGIQIEVTPGSDLHSDVVHFEIVDSDVDGVVIKTYKGASVTGQLIFEGDAKSNRPKTGQLRLSLEVQHPKGSYGKSAHLNPDLTFHSSGLKEGTINFHVSFYETFMPRELVISRVERDGAINPRIEIRDGDQVAGVKVFVRLGTATINGRVKVENGELPPNAQLSVWFTNTGVESARVRPQNVVIDSRGNFVLERLAAGTYEINVSVHLPGGPRRMPSAKQQVTVTDGEVAEVTISLNLSPVP